MSFGDGGSSTLNNTSHTYSGPGTYYITLTNTWKDSANTIVCVDSVTQPYTFSGPAVNEISGMIYWDSFAVSAYDSFKVWLIKYDSVTNSLSAVDSTLTAGALLPGHLQLRAQPAGSYRIKAASLNSVPVQVDFVPTYTYVKPVLEYSHSSEPYRRCKRSKEYLDDMGAVPAGPGFIAGNVSLGAGRGTSTGVPDLLIFLRIITTKW